MKTFIAKSFLSIALFLLPFLSLNGQTFLSHDYYADTTLTASGNPYIITDTMYLHPNVTLTIQPGVVIRFNSMAGIIVDKASIMAIGNAQDSIWFTSNGLQHFNYWRTIQYYGPSTHTSKFSFCQFEYAVVGLDLDGSADSLFADHSTFRRNSWGISGYCYMYVSDCMFRNNFHGMQGVRVLDLRSSQILNCDYGLDGYDHIVMTKDHFSRCSTAITGIDHSTIDSCTISSNDYGITNTVGNNLIIHSGITNNAVYGIFSSHYNHPDSIIYCNINKNDIGVLTAYGNNIIDNDFHQNRIGVKVGVSNNCPSIYGNCFYGNTDYALYYNDNYRQQIPNNYWGSNDSATIETVIFDSLDNNTHGRLLFVPFNSGCNSPNAVSAATLPETTVNIYPNPANDHFTIHSDNSFEKATLAIYNSLGEIVKMPEHVNQQDIGIDCSSYSPGIYFVEYISLNGTTSHFTIAIQR